jgi:hypothetical protein
MTEALRMGTSDALDFLRLEGKVSGQTAKAPIASLLKTLAGQSIYGFKPGTGIHILGGNYVIGSALMTTEAMNHGLEMTNKGGVAGLQDQFTQNVFSGRAPIFQGFGDSTMGSGWAATAIAKTAKAGSFFIQNDHIMGKSFVHNGASWLFDQHVKPWFDGGKVGSFDRIFQKIKGFRLDPGTADVVEQHLANGDYGAARHAYAMNMTDQATFQWRPEDQGIALSKGDLAKTFGQIMVNPMATASVLDRLATSGSIGDRIGALATYGKNAGMLYGASRAMGLSGSNFLPWRVINLRGGPLWQDMVTLSQAPDSKRFDYALKVLEGLPPVSWVVQSIAAVKQYQAGRPWQAFLTMVSNSSTPNMRTQAQKTLESNPPVSWLKQGAKDVGRTFSFLNPPKH